MTISPDDLFEIALVVPNLEEAIEHFHHAFGYTFSPIVEGVLPLATTQATLSHRCVWQSLANRLNWN